MSELCKRLDPLVKAWNERPLKEAYPFVMVDAIVLKVLIWEAPDVETARQMLRRVIDNFGRRAPRAVNILEEGFDDAVAVLNLPEQYRKRLRTTNGIERLNEEVRRRERVIRIFPNTESAERLLGALLMEKDEAWSTDRQYFDMRAYIEWKQGRAVAEGAGVPEPAVAGVRKCYIPVV